MTQMLRKLLSTGVLLTDWEDCYLGEMSLGSEGTVARPYP
jgi:hypothetical protein